MTEPAQTAPPLDMQRFLGVVRRRAVSIVGVTLVVVALALAVTLVRSARYASGVQVEVRPLTLEELPFSGTADVNMETEAARVTQGQVAVRAAEMLGIGRSSLEQAVQGVDVTVRPNTTFLDISCSRQTPEAAQTCANAFAVAYVDDRVEQGDALIQARIDASNQRIAEAEVQVRELKQRLAGASPREQRLLRAQIDHLEDEIAEAVSTMVSLPAANPSAAVVSGSADLPRGPANKNYLFVIAIATMIGLVLGVGIALFRERLAEPVVDRYGFGAALVAPVLAVVPDARRRRAPVPELGSLALPGGPDAEAYRVAATVLLHLSRDDGPKVFGVAAVDEEGDASRSAAGLAVALCESGKRVMAVAFDLRTSSLHRYFGVSNAMGITDVLAGEAALDEVVAGTKKVPGLSVIAGGPDTETTAELLGAGKTERVVDELRSSFDFVVADTPPLSRTADLLSLAPLIDGVILTAAAGATLIEDVVSVRDQIDGVGGRIAGGILKVRVARGTPSLASTPV